MRKKRSQQERSLLSNLLPFGPRAIKFTRPALGMGFKARRFEDRRS